MKRMDRERRTAGFNVAELLLAVSVVAILSSLVVAIVGTVRERGREMRCRANIHQIVMGLRNYCNEHRGRFPQMGIDDEAWIGPMTRYVGTRDMFVCPSDYRLITSELGRVQQPGGGYRTISYDCLLRFRNTVLPDGTVVGYSLSWHEVFRSKGDNTVILVCPHHPGRRLFARVNGRLESVPDTTAWWER